MRFHRLIPPWLASRYSHWRQLKRRVLTEDILKHILTRRLDSREASSESAAGHLNVDHRKVVRALIDMEQAGLVRSESGQIQLTPEGEKWAIQILRAHRLWETYLAREARLPIGSLHGPAEQAEHHLSALQLDELDAALGHPRNDPHGDPIPTASGDIAPLGAQPLTRWPIGQPAQIVHLEDEPESLFAQIPAALRPGVRVQTLGTTDAGQLTVSDGRHEYPLSPMVAGNIQVAAVAAPPVAERWTRLSDLGLGEQAEVLEIGPELQGFTRRRLLDLGLTPRARVSVHLENAFGDPRAYRVRGTTIALRRDQASQIQVRKLSTAGATQS